MADNPSPATVKWASIVIIVLAVLGYAIWTGQQIEEINVVDIVRIKMVGVQREKTSYTSLPTEETTPQSSTTESLSITVPSRGSINLKAIERIVLEVGQDDPHVRHTPLVFRALENGRMNQLYSERDALGEFLVWLTYTDFESGERCHAYSTLLIESTGEMELAWRRACKEAGIWNSEISPALIELAEADAGRTLTGGNTPQPVASARVKSIGKIGRCLDINDYKIKLGLLSARGLINLCFVDGEISNDSFDRAERDEVYLAREIMLTMDAAYNVAEEAYTLYQEEEFLGSRLLFEALSLLNTSDAYFRNMVGANKEGLGDLQGAFESYDKAVTLDATNIHAFINRARVHLKFNRRAEARRDLQAALALESPDNTEQIMLARQLLSENF